MITDASPPRNGRVLRITIVLSALLHLLVFGLAFGTYDALEKAMIRRHTPDERIVTLSSALTINRKPRPAPPSHPTRAASRTPRSLQPAPQVAQVPVRVVRQPVVPPAKALHELEKSVPRAAVEAPRTVRATAPPRVEATPRAEKAAAQRAPQQVAYVHAPRAGHGRYSPEQLAQIQADLARSAEDDRRSTSTSAELSSMAKQRLAPQSMHQYPVNFQGVGREMRGPQGLCRPMDASWQSAGWNYYYVTCRAVRGDGSVREEPVPWPVRFHPNDDPFTGTARRNVPLAAPLPGWHPGPNDKIDPDLVEYLHQIGYTEL